MNYHPTPPPSRNHKTARFSLVIGLLLILSISVIVVFLWQQQSRNDTPKDVAGPSVEINAMTTPQPLTSTTTLFSPDKDAFIDYQKSFPEISPKVDVMAGNAIISNDTLWLLDKNTLYYEKVDGTTKTRELESPCTLSSKVRPTLLCYDEARGSWTIDSYRDDFTLESTVEVAGSQPVGVDSEGSHFIAQASQEELLLESAEGTVLSVSYEEFGEVRPAEIVYAQKNSSGFILVVANYEEASNNGGYLQNLWAVAVEPDGENIILEPLYLGQAAGSFIEGGDGALWFTDINGINRLAREGSKLEKKTVFKNNNRSWLTVQLSSSQNGVAALLMNMSDETYSWVDLSADK